MTVCCLTYIGKPRLRFEDETIIVLEFDFVHEGCDLVMAQELIDKLDWSVVTNFLRANCVSRGICFVGYGIVVRNADEGLKTMTINFSLNGQDDYVALTQSMRSLIDPELLKHAVCHNEIYYGNH